jgi:hypothetical protein
MAWICPDGRESVMLGQNRTVPIRNGHHVRATALAAAVCLRPRSREESLIAGAMARSMQS